MPAGFFRRHGAYGLNEVGNDIDDIIDAHPVFPGRNNGINNYVRDLTFTGSSVSTLLLSRGDLLTSLYRHATFTQNSQTLRSEHCILIPRVPSAKRLTLTWTIFIYR
jgi:hypothetical protein